jgi:sacsin
MSGVKLKISKMREACSGHLVPFEDLWGYKQTLDSYPGTIFRFPLRKYDQPSPLSSTAAQLNEAAILELLDTYFDEARVSMLFLKRVNSIRFKVWKQPMIGWSVVRDSSVKNEDDEDMLAKHATFDFSIKVQPGNRKIQGKDQWRIGVQTLPHSARPTDTPRRLTKNAECGIAALISTNIEEYPGPEVERLSTAKVLPRIFTTVPLPIPSDLPVHIHATFDLSGDRKSIGIDEVGPQSSASLWNVLLLRKFLPTLYFTFLADIHDVNFQFWPRTEPPKRTCAELLYGSFWQELPNSTKLLYPSFQLSGLSSQHDIEFLDIQDSVFDLLTLRESEALAPLLLALNVDLVTSMPKEIAKNIKTFPNIMSVTGEMLRHLMKLKRSIACLKQQMIDNPDTLGILLNLIKPETAQDTDLKELDGCHVLKLLNSTNQVPSLATLKFIGSPDTTADRYYVPCNKGLAVFLSFASNHLVSSSVAHQLGHIYTSGKFNLSPLRLIHVKKLVEMKPKVLVPDRDNNEWLAGFWKFWNNHDDINEPTSKVDNIDAQLFLATKNDIDFYTTPAQFLSLPGVVEPSIIEHRDLCNITPGLYQFKVKYMPKDFKNNETSFNNPDSFYRYLRALKSLSGSSGLGRFIRDSITTPNIEVSRTVFTITMLFIIGSTTN